MARSSSQNKNVYRKIGNSCIKITSQKASPTLVEELKCNQIFLAMFSEAPNHYLQYQFHLQEYRNYQLVQVYQLAFENPKTQNQGNACQTNKSQHLAQCISASLWTTCTNGDKNKDNIVRTIIMKENIYSLAKVHQKETPKKNWVPSEVPRRARQIILDS